MKVSADAKAIIASNLTLAFMLRRAAQPGWETHLMPNEDEEIRELLSVYGKIISRLDQEP